MRVSPRVHSGLILKNVPRLGVSGTLHSRLVLYGDLPVGLFISRCPSQPPPESNNIALSGIVGDSHVEIFMTMCPPDVCDVVRIAPISVYMFQMPSPCAYLSLGYWPFVVLRICVQIPFLSCSIPRSPSPLPAAFRYSSNYARFFKGRWFFRFLNFSLSRPFMKFY